jgi:HAD superfamily hydrolase (TIGR01509 family)
VVLIDVGSDGARDPGGAVLFDFGGTLDADGLRWSVRFHDAYVAGGGRLGITDFEPLFRTSDRALEVTPGIRTMGFRAMIAAQAAILGGLLPDGTAVDVAAIAHRVHADAVRVVRRNRELLESLRPEFRLGVVSNFTGNLDVCLAELGMRDLFAVVTDSAILGAAKPDPRVFIHTLDVLGVPPERAWVVGDNFEADVRPARDLGMRTVWLAAADRPTPAGCSPTARITSLTELPEVLLPARRTVARAPQCTA